MPNRAIPIPPLARQVTDRADQVRRSRLLNELDEALSRAEARSPKKASQPRPVPYQPINSNQGLTDDQAQTLFPNLPLTWSTGTRQLFERQGRGEVFDEDYTEPVDVSPPEDHKWHPLSEQTKATVRTKMSRCFPPPDAPTVGPRTQSIIENLRAKTAALLNHPRAIELAITTPDGRKVMPDGGVFHQFERPPDGCSDGIHVFFCAQNGAWCDTNAVAEYRKMAATGGPRVPLPAHVIINIETWREGSVNLDLVRWRGTEVIWLESADSPEPA